MNLKSKIWVLVLVAICNTSTLFAQQLNVHIVAKDDAEPIALATVILNCAKVKIPHVATDAGLVQLPAEATNCVATISSVGYEQLIVSLQNYKDGDSIFCTRKNASIPEVVITGQPQKIAAEKSIYKVFTINERAIKQQAALTLADVMSNELGFYKQNDNLLGSATNLMGIGGQNIKVLINGAVVNGRENGNIDLNQINVTNAERIEVVKGPMSVLYGTDALGGVINIITKNAKNKHSLTLNNYAESINKINTGLEYSKQYKQHGFYINANRNFFGGYLFSDNFKRATLWKPKVQYTADANYTLQLKKGKITYSPNYMWERITDRGTPIIDPFSASVLDQEITTSRMAHMVNAELAVDSTTKISFNNSISRYHRMRNTISKDLASEDGIRDVIIRGVDTNRFTDYNFRSIGNSIITKTTSLMYGYDVNAQTSSSSKLLNRAQAMTDYAVYGSVAMQLSKAVQMQPSIRLSYNTKYYVPAVPSINFKIDLPRKAILRASYARGFRAPSLKELFLDFVDINHNIKGNVNLKPEYATHMQATMEWVFWQKGNNKLQTVYAAYYNDINNQIALGLKTNTASEYIYVNIGSFKNFAQDVRLNYISKKWNTQFGASVNNIIKRDSLKAFTTWEMMCRANYLVGKYNTGLNVVYRFVSSQPIISISSLDAGGFSSAYLPQQHLADMNITQNFLKDRLNVQLGVRNLFAISTLAIQGNTSGGIHNHGTSQFVSPGRSAFVGLRWTLLKQ
jgi:outer membrane receptor for ferrienterochelin and colicins